MNIGFDGKRAANNLTGLGNYSRSLILKLAELFHQNHYYVYSPTVKKAGQIASFFSLPSIQLKLPTGLSPAFWWRSFSIFAQLQKDNIRIYHGLSNEIPFGLKKSTVKTVVTIHDLIFLRLPQNYKLIDRIIYNYKSRYACHNADQIIAISEKTKSDIIELYQIDPEKITVIYQSCDDSFKKLLPSVFKEKIREKYDLPEKYILNVGTIEPRKNLLQLVNALVKVQKDYKLVVVGKEQAYARIVHAAIKALGLSDRVIFLKNIPFSDLPAIYQMASVFVYPSIYEGFGIPIIEALFSKVPVVAATGSCLEEAGGPDSLYVSPENVAGLSIAINSIIENQYLALKMQEKGLAFAARFNAEDLTEQLMNCYLRLCENTK